MLLLLLAGCSSPTITPVQEVCTGTKRPYQINGIQYTPQEHYEYDETGVASWYGPGFHDRPTSCGSRYDMHAMTAAHKTLPIPSVVEVTNIENGKTLHLVVNDRGPFVDDRIIDLSKKAAQELGTHNKGLGRVRVKALPEESLALANYLKQYGRYGIDPSGRTWDTIYMEEIAGNDLTPQEQKEPPLPPPQETEFAELLKEVDQTPKLTLTKAATPLPKKKQVIQVGTFVQKQNALKLKESLAIHGPIKIRETKIKGQRFFTVELGPFTKQKQALQLLGEIRQEGHYDVKLANGN